VFCSDAERPRDRSLAITAILVVDVGEKLALSRHVAAGASASGRFRNASPKPAHPGKARIAARVDARITSVGHLLGLIC